MMKLLTCAAALATGLTLSSAAFAQSSTSTGVTGPDSSGSSNMTPGQGNAGGAQRGLDRADSVAGDNGAKGRDNARAKQGDTTSGSTGSGTNGADTPTDPKPLPR